MRIWQFSDPYDYSYAIATRLGTWHPEKSGGVCPVCGATRQRRVRPLVIEWEPGSDVVGDFSWPGLGGDIIVTDRVARSMVRRVCGFEFRPVRMVGPELGAGEGEQSHQRARPRVHLPYEGPKLYDLWVTCWAHVDMDRSSVALQSSCDACGWRSFEVEGIEKELAEWDDRSGELARVRTPRVPGKGLYVSEGQLANCDVFRIHEFPECVLCTDRVRDLVQRERFTNVDFMEMGDVF